MSQRKGNLLTEAYLARTAAVACAPHSVGVRTIVTSAVVPLLMLLENVMTLPATLPGSAMSPRFRLTRESRAARLLAAVSLCSFLALAHAGIDDGLMAYWKFDGNAMDSGPNGNHGLIHGGVTPTADHRGREGMALRFDGVDGYVSIPDSATLHSPNQRTVSMWFRAGASRQFNVPMLVQGNHAQGPDGCEATRELQVFFYPGSSEVQAISAGDGGCQNLLSAPVPQARNWHQVTAVIDRSTLHTIQLYVDGELKNSVPDPYSSFNTSDEELRIAWTVEQNGRRYEPFHGELDEVRLYDRALSRQEVKDLYESDFDISGTARGFSSFGVWCRNKTTGQEIKAGRSHGVWDCESAGLVVAPGDEVSVGISGTAR